MSADHADNGTREAWKPRPGNYHITEGTWLRAPGHRTRETGIVADTPELHESGTVKIEWFPNTAQFLSAPAFRQMLRTGEIVVNDRQHPYDKLEWVGDRR